MHPDDNATSGQPDASSPDSPDAGRVGPPAPEGTPAPQAILGPEDRPAWGPGYLAAGEGGYTAPPAPIETAGGRRRGTGPVIVLAAVLVAILGGGALFISGYQLGRHQSDTPGTPASEEQAFQPFWDAYHAVVDRYAGGPVDREKLIEGAIRGMIGAVGDPYSTYLSADEFRQTLNDINGQFEGIGAEIGTVDATGKTADCSTLGTDCRLVIIAPMDGSPSQKGGLKPGDIVEKVDGDGLDGLTVSQARDKIRGPKGTVVTLTIVRDGAAPQDFRITRDVIVEKEVGAKDLAGGTVGYIRISAFSDSAASDFVDALKKDLGAGEKKIILDLRGNPGGFVTAARTVASAFIASGPVFWQEDSKGVQTPTEALPGGIATDLSIKVVVLIDKGSASASEIVAGALQDTKRATLVGETSFGKGTVQQWTDLGTAGGFKLTIAKWLTPDKRWIHTIGLTPDVPVEVPASTPAGSDPVLDKALELLAGSAALPVSLPKAA